MKAPTASACMALLFFSALGAPLAHAAPPPGEYRIDGEASVRSGSGPTATERIERWDGATGRRTVMTHAGPPGNPGCRQTYAGNGPVTWCVPSPAAAPANLLGRCDARWWPTSGGGTLQADCKAGRMQEHWKQLGPQAWERQMTFTSSAGAGGNDPAAALALAQRGMSPAEAARAKAELAALPAANDTASAMAPVYAQIEETIRKGPPQEAAAAREQLAALKAAQGGGGTMSTTTRLTERWTLIAKACGARQ